MFPSSEDYRIIFTALAEGASATPSIGELIVLRHCIIDFSNQFINFFDGIHCFVLLQTTIALLDLLVLLCIL